MENLESVYCQYPEFDRWSTIQEKEDAYYEGRHSDRLEDKAAGCSQDEYTSCFLLEALGDGLGIQK